ncbi:MAG: hypothetical protein CVU90_04375 [Firmicutes bacterium HGW-Firmicutes-15]|nr:MAG: hypothetical protein CVU90_04375 [Firmicutes bacterium HGW-Firmicutes-15]
MLDIKTFLTDIKTMDPIIRENAFDSEDFLYQVKWDGVRIIAAISGETVYLRNKRGNHRTEQYPELQSLAGLLGVKNAVLDGEIVVLRKGKPSFPGVMQRDRSSTAMSIKHASKTLPISYMVFDLLFLNGRDLRQQSLMERIFKMTELFDNQEYLHQVESFSEGTTLFEAVRSAGIEGIVAKRKTSLYSPGKNHSDWYKIKCLQTQNCLVGGYTLRANQVNALLLGVVREGKLNFAGKAANGLSSEHLKMLSEELPALEVGTSPFDERSQRNHHYIEPRMAVLVEFLEWTESLHLRFPVIKAFINVMDSDCSV